MSFVEVARTDEVTSGAMKSFLVGGKQILVSNIDGTFYAMDAICTHAGSDLSEGKLEGKIVTCPNHGSKFDVATGISIAGPKIGFLRIKTKNEPIYEVKVEGESLKIDI